MNHNDEFYIGYLDNAPEGQKKFIKKWIYILLGIVILVAVFFSIGQSSFKNSSFELGNLRKLTGVFYHSPHPMLRVELKDNQFKDILLVGFGKFGADQVIDKGNLEDVQPSNGQEMTFEGTLIYYDGKALFQLQPNLEGTYQVAGLKNIDTNAQSLGGKVLEGEIVDPKCYFGVMKPGSGKIHRSCATRCLSGGIPPVLVTTDQDGYHEYYILTDSQGNKLGREILSMVGKPSKIQGELYRIGDWNYLWINPQDIELTGSVSSIYVD